MSILLTSYTSHIRGVASRNIGGAATAAKAAAHSGHGGHHKSTSFISSALGKGDGSKIKTSYTPNIRRHYSTHHPSGPVTVLGDDRHSAQPPPYQTTYMKDMSKYDDQASRNSAYFLVGSLSTISAMGAKNVVTDILVNMSASADVLALSKVEVNLANIPEGKNVVLKWRGKPIFIRHRTADEIAEANQVDMNELRHKETDADRTKKPEWLVMLGVCTHLGCVPVGEAGEYGGWFCPCHGSHYDISGRIRKGPAPLNLEIPLYEINDESQTLIIG